jgi:hypothetical protein
MDVKRAIESFRARSPEARLALVTDDELRSLFGAELAAVVDELARDERYAGLCRRCGGNCCAEIGCELFAPELDRCPIHAYRPIACRLHYCHLFDAAHRELVIALRDVFLACQGEAAPDLEGPPLLHSAPGLASRLRPLVEEMLAGRLSRAEGARRIAAEVARYRSQA